MARRKALGRGLKALLPDTPAAIVGGLIEVDLDSLHPRQDQPRAYFDDEGIDTLSESIRQHGLLQPILVHERDDGGFEIIAGERRFRAARQAELDRVPVYVSERLDPETGFEIALVENLQRRDLTPMEEARGFERLRTDSGRSQAEIASKVGMSRSAVANSLRLLKLDGEIQEMLENGSLSAGHARALLGFDDHDEQRSWAHQVVDRGLTVRDVERAAASQRKRGTRKKTPRDPNLSAAEERLALHVGARVEITSGRRGGRIVIRCDSREELMRVYDQMIGA